ncbi:MAG: hypothetical protein ABF608_02075 [Sporolactobacillus sp.]
MVPPLFAGGKENTFPAFIRCDNGANRLNLMTLHGSGSVKLLRSAKSQGKMSPVLSIAGSLYT